MNSIVLNRAFWKTRSSQVACSLSLSLFLSRLVRLSLAHSDQEVSLCQDCVVLALCNWSWVALQRWFYQLGSPAERQQALYYYSGSPNQRRTLAPFAADQMSSSFDPSRAPPFFDIHDCIATVILFRRWTLNYKRWLKREGLFFQSSGCGMSRATLVYKNSPYIVTQCL